MPLRHSVDMSAQMRAMQALELRIKGMQWGDIAKQTGYPSPANAYRAAKNLLDKRQAESVDEYRRIEDIRLDALLQAIWLLAIGNPLASDSKLHKPNLFAVDRVLAICERRARLFGLDIKPEADPITAQVLIREIAAPVGDV